MSAFARWRPTDLPSSPTLRIPSLARLPLPLLYSLARSLHTATPALLSGASTTDTLTMAKSTSSSSPRKPTSSRGPSPPVRLYLTGYNLVSAGLWAYVLYRAVEHMAGADGYTGLKEWAGWQGTGETLAKRASGSFDACVASEPLLRYALEECAADCIARAAVRAASARRSSGSRRPPSSRQCTPRPASCAFHPELLRILLCLQALTSATRNACTAPPFSRSPLGTTVAQITSRLMLVWGVGELFPEVRPALNYCAVHGTLSLERELTLAGTLPRSLARPSTSRW